jgi:hypothetical protein
MANEFQLTVRAKPGVDAVRALRGWLKVGLRRFGFKCVKITPEKETVMVDARKYAPKYIKPDNVRDGPIRAHILAVLEDERFGRLLLELDTGSQFALNETNTNTLIKAWHHDTEAWRGQEIILELGTYKDWREDTQKETVRVRVPEPANAEAQNGGAPANKPLPPARVATSLKGDLDDEIPF